MELLKFAAMPSPAAAAEAQFISGAEAHLIITTKKPYACTGHTG